MQKAPLIQSSSRSRIGKTRWLINLVAIFVLSSQVALADAPLKSRLNLDTDQAKVVYEIQKRYRAEKRGVRQVLNKESRELRRAKSDNNSDVVAQLTDSVSVLEQQMSTVISNEDEEIRGVLNAEQLLKFEHFITERNQTVGSSRDVKVL